MTECHDILERLLLGGRLDDRAGAHVRGCVRCREEAPIVQALSQTLAADVAAPPPAALSERLLRAAAPLLARNSRRAAWRPVARAVAAALLPLPAIIVFDAYVVRAAYTLLAAILPAALSFYLVLNYTLLLALLFTLSYGAIPLLAARQARRLREVSYG